MTESFITCDKCPESTCCTKLNVNIGEPTNLDDWGEIRWMVAHKNVSVVEEQDGEWSVVFDTACDELLPNGDCGIYSIRPQICADYSMTECPKNGLGPLYVKEFKTLEQVDEFIREEVIPALEESAQNFQEQLDYQLSRVRSWPEKVS